MTDNHNFYFIPVIYFSLVIVLAYHRWIPQSYSQGLDPITNQQHELQQLQKTIRIESEEKQHHIAEQAMDRLIEVMLEFGTADEQVSKQVQERVRYSIREKRFLSGYEAAKRWVDVHLNDRDVLFLLATASTYIYRYREARDYWRALYEFNPKNEYFQKELLSVLKGLHDRDEGVPLCTSILKDQDISQKLKLFALHVLVDLEMEEEVIEQIETVEPFEGQASFMAYTSGVVLFDKNQFEDALESFQQVEQGHSRFMEAQTQMALCFFRLQRYEDAVRQNLKVLSYDLYNLNAYVNLAQSLARLRNANASRMLLSQQKTMERNEIPKKEGDYYWSKGDLVEYGRLQAIGLNLRYKFQEAERLLETICLIMPESVSAKINLGKHYFSTLQAAKAEMLFRDILKQTQRDEQKTVQALLVEALLRQDKIDDVLEMSTKHKNTIQTHAFLGSYYLEMKQQPDKAVGYFEDIDNATFTIQLLHAKCLSQLNQPLKAVELLKQIPDEFGGVEQKSVHVDCLIQLGKLNEAKALFDETIRMEEDIQPFLTVPLQAKLSAALKEDDAKELLAKSMHLIETQKRVQEKVFKAQRLGLPDSAALLVEISELLEAVGDHQNALLYARRAYNAEPNQPGHLRRLIGMLTDDEHVVERYYLIEKAKQAKHIPENFEKELGEIFGVLGIKK